jgi:hypothetical protein
MNLRSDVAIDRICEVLRNSWNKEAIEVNNELGLGCDVELLAFKDLPAEDQAFYRAHARAIVEEVINMLSEED